MQIGTRLTIAPFSILRKNTVGRVLSKGLFSVFNFFFLGGLFLLFCFTSCTPQHPYEAIAPGVWRGVLKLEGGKAIPLNRDGKPSGRAPDVEDVTEGELPFLMEVVYTSPNEFFIEIINGEERIKVTEIGFGRDQTKSDDTIRINLPVYDSYIKAVVEQDIIEGTWYVPNKGEYSIPFVARHSLDHRFTHLKKTPKMDVSGKWEVMFGVDSPDSTNHYPALGIFEQKGNHLLGTFLTETGDYRFLEGSIQNNKIYLSCFDGAHAFLFEGKILEDNTMTGSFMSGNHYKTTWVAEKNEDYVLPDPYALTYLKDEGASFDFTFSDLSGKKVSLSDPTFDGKVKLVQIMGTWCPNCADETFFLKEIWEQNKKEELAIISVGFERYKDELKARNAISKYQDRLDIPYTMLYGGYYQKSIASEAFPMLNKIISYPTLIVVDKQGEIRKIHTGFSGPATPNYPAFVENFELFLEKLLSE